VEMKDMILVSVDDHVVEPANMFERHTPAKYKDRMPKITAGAQGEDIWVFDGMTVPNMALNAVAGRPKEEYGMEPTAFSQLRKGCYDVDARIGDMNVNGQLAGLNFPSFPGVAGQTMLKAPDKDIALVVVQSWNDWHIDDWCGKYQGALFRARSSRCGIHRRPPLKCAASRRKVATRCRFRPIRRRPACRACIARVGIRYGRPAPKRAS
jgi:hypothetical protein